MVFRKGATALIALAGLAAAAGAGQAQEKPLAIELNRTTAAGAGCRLTFVARNDTGAVLEKVSYEVAFFDSNKQVAQLIVLPFGRLPVGKTKVVEFGYDRLACGAISRILVNAAPDCLVSGGPSPVCLDGLKTSTLTDIVFDL